MNKTVKVVSVCMILSLLLLALVSCGPSMEEVAGTYSGSYTSYMGHKYYVVIILDDDGTYARATSKDGILSSSDSGDYEIKGSTVRLYIDSEDHYVDYSYKDGVLENGGYQFTKQ